MIKVKEQKPAGKSDQQKLVHAGDNLYRSDKTQIYYAIFKRGKEQKRRSLKTTDKDLARRKLAEYRDNLDQLKTGDAAKVAFSVLDANGNVAGGLLKEFFDNKLGEQSPRSQSLTKDDAKSFAVAFNGQPARNVSLGDVEAWAKTRRPPTVGASTFNRNLQLLRRVFKYAILKGIRLDNPADEDKIDKATEAKTGRFAGTGEAIGSPSRGLHGNGYRCRK